MGNALSEEEEEQLLEEAYEMSLESPEADYHLNAGTAAPNCQPKHTRQREKQRDDGQELIDKDDRRKRRQMDEEQKKMSYYQMARLGYQELVNAIIRPPRAEYKVCTNGRLCLLSARFELVLLTLLHFDGVLDGSTGPPCFYLLWKTIHKNRFYSANKTRLQPRVFSLGTCRTCCG